MSNRNVNEEDSLKCVQNVFLQAILNRWTLLLHSTFRNY